MSAPTHNRDDVVGFYELRQVSDFLLQVVLPHIHYTRVLVEIVSSRAPRAHELSYHLLNFYYNQNFRRAPTTSLNSLPRSSLQYIVFAFTRLSNCTEPYKLPQPPSYFILFLKLHEFPTGHIADELPSNLAKNMPRSYAQLHLLRRGMS